MGYTIVLMSSNASVVTYVNKPLGCSDSIHLPFDEAGPNMNKDCREDH